MDEVAEILFIGECAEVDIGVYRALFPLRRHGHRGACHPALYPLLPLELPLDLQYLVIGYMLL